ncbi:protein lunapark-like [Scleropages formosus]|uniref:Endoplasmic reticulum junction formation protein lunapark n=1 Tax=Scleropages formosus TaxID=113540 RepID=A0A0P7UJR6_SCLFO|nr:protein lunapark-like [Scleropages formosus]
MRDIQHLEEFRVKNQRLLKLWVGRLLLYSALLYLLTCAVVYLWYLPDRWSGWLILALPFFLFPILVWFMRKLLIYLFSKRTEKNNEKLEDLKSQKRKILEEVMETETYKNAKLILERFDSESKIKMALESTPAGPQVMPRPGQVRQRNVVPKDAVSEPPISGPQTPTSSATPVSAPGGPPEKGTPVVAGHQGLARRPMSPGSSVPGVGMHPPGPPLARPVLPRERGAFDRVIEYLVGDGPQNRYALICQQCLSHNGMALKEEFEYVAFRCAYCYFLNPARKTRPQAPRPAESLMPATPQADSAAPTAGVTAQEVTPSPRHETPSQRPQAAEGLTVAEEEHDIAAETRVSHSLQEMNGEDLKKTICAVLMLMDAAGGASEGKGVLLKLHFPLVQRNV